MTVLKVHRLRYDRSCLRSVWRWHINDLFSPIFLASKSAQVARDVMIERTRSLFIAFQFKIIKLQGSTGLGRGSLRKRLNDNYIAVSKQSITAPPPSEPNTDVRQPPKKSAAAIAEVADRLTACTSSQSIMTAVLSTFAA
ncbi:hypothetical protein Vadar_015134 [Vaccinium darrowii]|uniref:Uncharacterized protein n=1 Tax=Vaccinium darrowii TaxID=229202 RepID=A0ACB7X9Q0_9ERIC|nr:hypothetical protein Vadar_015134 [Vaccinium darrowii]